jgi:hypothetical protein
MPRANGFLREKSGVGCITIKRKAAAISRASRKSYSGAGFRYWHLADNPTAPEFVRYWTKADKGRFQPADGLSDNYPFKA